MIVCQVEHNDYNKWPCECSINISHLTDSHDSHNPTTVANLENNESTNTSDFTTAPPTDILRECMYGFVINQMRPNVKEASTSPYFSYSFSQAGGEMVGDGCGHGDDVFLMSIVLFFGVFIIANGLKQFKTTGFLSQGVRGFLADFAVIIGILVMTGEWIFMYLYSSQMVR